MASAVVAIPGVFVAVLGTGAREAEATGVPVL